LNNHFWKVLACAALALLAIREFRAPETASAQMPTRSYYIEPGTVEIPIAGGGNALGKIVVNLDTGETYGFPVFGPKLPYPGYQVSEWAPLVSKPVYLGRFDFANMSRSATVRQSGR
jgi:hypothetical protein